MTDIDKKREEIREELAMVLAHIDGRYWNDLTVVEAGDYIKKTERVVIKVDRELPEPTFGITINGRNVSRKTTHCIAKSAHIQLIDAGYVAVEPLIESPEAREARSNAVGGGATLEGYV